jgi:hypothetical protein
MILAVLDPEFDVQIGVKNGVFGNSAGTWFLNFPAKSEFAKKPVFFVLMPILGLGGQKHEKTAISKSHEMSPALGIY